MKNTAVIKLVFYLISISFISCDSDRATIHEINSSKDHLEIPSEIRDVFDRLQYNLKSSHKRIIDNLSIRFSTNKSLDYENNPKGFCIKVMPTPIIYLYKKDWVGEKAKSIDIQELSLLHLIGHCVYNLKHNNKTIKYKDDSGVFQHYTSLMASNFNWQKFSPKFIEKHKTDFQKKLVHQFLNNEIK